MEREERRGGEESGERRGERAKIREERKDHSAPLPGRAGAGFPQTLKEGLKLSRHKISQISTHAAI